MQYVRYPAGLYSVLDCVRRVSRRSFTCYVSLPPLPTSLFPSCSFARPFSRSLVLAACLSLSFFDVILPCYYLYHRSRSAIREVAEKRNRDERRSRKEVSRELAAKLTFYIDCVTTTHRVIVFANIVQIVFDAVHFIVIIFEKLRKIMYLNNHIFKD